MSSSPTSAPVAAAVAAAAAAAGEKTPRAKNAETVPGRGASAIVEGKRVFVGEPSWVETEVGAEGGTAAALGAAAAENSEALGGPAAAACSLVCVGVEGEGVIGALALADRVRPGAAASVRRLQDMGMRVVVLSGDRQPAVDAVAFELGLTGADAVAVGGLLPDDKAAFIERLRAEANGKGVAMVGDGINDAPALAAADVGVAVASTPSEAAAAAADVLLLHADADGISQLPDVFALAEKTRRVLKQNITLAVISILGSALPALTGAFPLWLAVLLHEGSTLLVALNSVRLLGTFGNAQKMRKSTTFALVGVFGLCCLGGAWLLPAVRKAALFNAASVVVSPAFLVAATTLKSAWAGLLAGCLHTLTGPDHLAALAPLTVGPSRAQNALMGALWGCGHNTGQMLFGLVFVLLKDKLPFNMEIIGQWGQGIVGGTLVIIGIMGWWEARAMARGDNHSHSHSHSHGLPFGIGKDMFGDGHTHSHSHSHDEGDVTANLRFAHAHAESSDSEGSNAAADASTVSIETEEQRRKNTDGSFLSWTYITGTIHGLQPDALLLLLPAFALPRLQAVAFLGTFFVGTVVAMGTYTACLGAGTSALQKHNPKAVSLVSGISSAVAVAIGVAFILSAVFGFEIF
mmetsp:Transcript_8497/g.35498  ORF Transcript_8497/g.35498 Transcript_8497/m.35498 type:complete len:633 (-) Transcript_8497:117-2015(-)